MITYKKRLGREMTEAKKVFNKNQYDNVYKKLNYDRLNFLMPKGTKEKIQTAAEQKGIASSEWIRQAISEKLERDLE